MLNKQTISKTIHKIRPRNSKNRCMKLDLETPKPVIIGCHMLHMYTNKERRRTQSLIV